MSCHATDRKRRATPGDARWTDICRALERLRTQRRRAVRIVDADCGCGTLLIAAAAHARALGFTAIEARGIDSSPALIGRAQAAAARLHDPAIGLSFELADVIPALRDEADMPADIVLWRWSGNDRPGTGAALAAAGDTLIDDVRAPGAQAIAA